VTLSPVRLGDSASHNNIFLSRQISQPASQPTSSVFLSRQISQPASQPNKAFIFIGWSELILQEILLQNLIYKNYKLY
jgi:hypothetical protein